MGAENLNSKQIEPKKRRKPWSKAKNPQTDCGFFSFEFKTSAFTFAARYSAKNGRYCLN
jgi:hypothetical protein